jgi:nucleoid-associated protein YgaU
MPSRPTPRGARPAAPASPGLANPLAAVALAGASLVAATGVGLLFLVTARDAWVAVAAAGPAGPADGILLVVAVLGALLSLWMGLGVALSALAALPGALGQASGVLAARIAPAAARKVVAVVLGTTLTAALAPGTAVVSTDQAASRPASVSVSQIAFGALPDAAPDASFRWVSEATPAADAAPPPSWSPDRHPSPESRVEVRRGDTLWSIAAHRLGPSASGADIDAEWRRWFAANRKVIGDDANRIAPGELLIPPLPSPASS